MSAMATNSTFGTSNTCLSRSSPRPPTPIIPTRMRSFAPSTRADDGYASIAAVPQAVRLIKSRLVFSTIGDLLRTANLNSPCPRPSSYRWPASDKNSGEDKASSGLQFEGGLRWLRTRGVTLSNALLGGLPRCWRIHHQRAYLAQMIAFA